MSASSKPRFRLEAGWILWGVFALVMGVLVGLKPEAHTVTPEYRGAALKWLQGEDLYHLNSIHGFLYFPSSALLYLPITLLPLALGEVIWRLMGIALLAWAIWKLSGQVLGSQRDRWFWLVSLLVIPACLSSARNGQTNLPLSACMILTVVDLTDQRWNRAALWLGLTLLLKPIAMAMILLIFCLHPPMRLRLVLAILGVALLPWINLHWDYVWREHLLFGQKMALASDPQANDYCDLRGLLLKAGIQLPSLLLTGLRFILGLDVLLLCWLAARRFPHSTANFLLGALTAIYLMLGNPRTETNSYVILAPFLALSAVEIGFRKNRCGVARFLSFLVLSLAADSYGSMIFHATDIWFKPLIALVFLVFVSHKILSSAPRNS